MNSFDDTTAGGYSDDFAEGFHRFDLEFSGEGWDVTGVVGQEHGGHLRLTMHRAGKSERSRSILKTMNVADDVYEALVEMRSE